MAGKVLIVDIYAELYRDRLLAEFPGLQFMLFHKAAEVSADLSAIDIMIMFGIEIRDHMLRYTPRLQWIQSLATGVDHFLALPVLTKARSYYQRSRHSRRADARACPLSDAGDQPRREAAGRRSSAKCLAAPAVVDPSRQDRGHCRYRGRRRRDR